MSSAKTEQLVHKAQAHIRNNDIAGAITCYKKITELNKNNASAWSALGSLHGRLTQYREAADCFRNAAKLASNDANTHLNLAKCLHALNSLEDASKAYHNALRVNPELPEALYNMGTLLSQQNNFKEATSYFQRLTRILPDQAQGFYSLASAQIALGLFEDAEKNLRTATTLQPDLAEAHNSLGVTRQKLHQYDAAEKSYIRSIELNSNDAGALYNLGTLRHETARFDDAKRTFIKALQLRPDYKEAYLALGLTHHTCAEFQAAIECYEAALKQDPDYTDALINLGQTLQTRGDFEKALTMYRKATRIDPTLIEGITGEANILEHNGDFENALGLIKPLIDSMSYNANLAVTYGILARRTNSQQQAIPFLERIASSLSLPAIPRAKIDFSLGHLYQDINDYDKAFQHFHRANITLNYRFDRSDHVAFIDSLIDTFRQGNPGNLAHSNNASEKPIFIVAMPRSGTSLVEQIIASHPDVYGAGELPYIGQIRNSLCSRIGGELNYPECLTRANEHFMDKLADSYLGHTSTGNCGHPKFTDKMPHNFIDLGLINMMLPHSRIIHVIRDPIDTCLSIYTQHFAASHSYSSDLDALGFYYRQYMRLMEHWHSVLSIPILDVHYADIVTQPEETIRKLLDFCDLEWNAACLNFHQSKRRVNTPSYDQVRQPIYTSGLERWKKYDRHLGPLKRALEQ